MKEGEEEKKYNIEGRRREKGGQILKEGEAEKR
jgi:hypothetical protein